MRKIPNWLLHYSSTEMFIVGFLGGSLSPWLCEWLNICQYKGVAVGLICFAVGVAWLSVKHITVITLTRISARKGDNNETT